MTDARLKPWLELADELEHFVRFMHAVGLVPQRTTAAGSAEYVDVGEAAIIQVRTSAARSLRLVICKKWEMEGAIRTSLHTLFRRISEGAFYGSEGTPEHREMMARLGNIEARFDRLVE